MKYKIYIFSKDTKLKEMLEKKSFSTLDECIEELQLSIPHLISRKDIDTIVIRKKED